jgi:predicted transcriptional regulator
MGDDYNLILAHSNLRTDVLISLSGEKKSPHDLRKELNVSSSTASHALRELENSNFVYHDAERNYLLTNSGKILTNRLIDDKDLMETLHKFESFWLKYDLSAIPDHLLDKIGWLKDSRIVSGTPVLVFKAYETVINLLKDAKEEVKVVSSILIPDTKLIHDLYAGQREMRAILTEELLHSHIELTGQEQLRKAIEKNLKLYVVRQNLKIGFFTVTDRFMALVPYRLDGVFDWSSDLISFNKTAIDWGLALFNHYAEVAESVDLS